MDSPAGSTPVGTQLSANSGKRGSMAETPSFGQLTSASGMFTAEGSKRRKLANEGSLTFSNVLPSELGSSSFLSDFRVPSMLPEAPPVAESDIKYNAKQSVQRMVVPGEVEAVSKHELAFMLKTNERSESFTIENDDRYAGTETVEQTPVMMVNVAVWNYSMALKQWREFSSETEETKQRYENSCPYDHWKDWTVEGVVEAEELYGGGESETTSGLSLGSSAMQNTKSTTVVCRGGQFMYNIFGESVTEGATLWGVLTKSEAPDSYRLVGKNNLSGTTSGRSIRIETEEDELSMPDVDGSVEMKPTSHGTQLHHLFRPYQLKLLAVPSGESVPVDYLTYVDERGLMRYDGLAIYLGRVFSVPTGHEWQPLTTNAHEQRNLPVYTDATVGHTKLLKALLNVGDSVMPV